MSTPENISKNNTEPDTPHNVTPANTAYSDSPNTIRSFGSKSQNETSPASSTDSLCDSEDSDSTSSSHSSIHVKEYKAIGTWGTYGVDPTAFCDKYRPVVRNFKDLELDDEDLNGFLTDKIIANGSSYLEKCPLIGKYVLCKAVLSYKGLSYIGALKFHHYLQYLDLSHNEITDVTVLNNLPFLIHLDVSHNDIHELLSFNPPFNLTFVIYSHNAITKMKDLSNFWAIKTLDLSHNQIETICGLQNLKYLENLDLSHNLITKIENLDNLNIITLKLHHNQISSFVCDSTHGFKTMPLLTYVTLSHNDLTNLQMFENSAFIQSIDIQNNDISSLLEISQLQSLNLLISVNFSGNPVRNCENYETVCFDTIKNLQYLDGYLVEVEKKVVAKPSFNLETKMRVGQQSSWNLGLSHLTALPCLGADVLPSDVPPRPLVVVVGPIGSGLHKLIQQFSHAHPHSVSRLILHTDRDMSTQEIPSDFHFIYPKHFQKMLENGEFVVVFNILNDNYGLSHKEFSCRIRAAGKVMIMWADLNAALELRLRGLQPYIILGLPRLEQTHRQWITEGYETKIYNIKYPEAAVNIFNRESTLFTHSSSRSFSSNPFECSNIASMKNQKSTHDIETSSNTDEICSYEDDYYEDIQKIYRKLIGMDQYCWDDFNKKCCPQDCEGDCDCNISSLSEEFYEGLSFEGSTIIFPENLAQQFYSKVLKSREKYLDFHRENPGVFYDVVYTDQIDKAMETLKHVCKVALRVQRKKIQVETVDNNIVCKSFVDNRLKMLEDDIEKAMVRNIRCDR